MLKGPTHLWDFLKNIIRCSTLLVRTQLQQYIFLFTTSGIVWIWWRHYCKRTRTQVWPFIAYTHRKGWRSIVASSINVDEFVCFLLILTYKRENMVKHGFWVKVSVGCGENFLVIYIIWSTSFQLAVEVVEGDILKPYQIFHDIHWMRGLFVTWKPNINYILDTLDAFGIWILNIRYSHTYH